ncbi:MAG: hypothetical protein R3320_14490 [Nitriliruptorales bacterium]|nr:hypothetical protein [Nitriliruptorales bacterium]
MNTAPTIRPVRKPRPTRRTTAFIAATLVMLVGLATGAHAQSAGFDEQQHEEGLFYGNFDQDILLFAGGTTEDACNGDEPTHSARVFSRHDGSVDIMVDASEQPIYLYSSPLGAPELLAATCAAMFDSDPSTVPLEPFAEGAGLVRMRIEIAADGTVHVVNSTVGAATSADGTTWTVRGWADLMVVDGIPIGDPAEFQGLRITRTGV